ncbi:MAG: hypothetical protein QOF74_7421 [Caballeronia mineralivorans]|jgi:hypothetical protein|nr:hypothetical protein [Caballeronia mineralivorans]
MRCDLYSTGTDKWIISCTVGRGFAQHLVGYDVCKSRFMNPDFMGTIQPAPRSVRVWRICANPKRFFNRTAMATAFGMLIVLVC